MAWINFSYYASFILLFWALGIFFLFAHQNKMKLALILFALGTVLQAIFIFNLWQILMRPPMRTLGETRLWYSFFTPLIGYFVYFRWQYKWLLGYSILMGGMFTVINMCSPEVYNKSLMPALQSIWFVPHVLVYLFAYAMLSASFLCALAAWFGKDRQSYIDLADNLVYLGLGFLTLGLLFGALWAKEAWGHYWAWDPKEIWAFLTWMGYLLYIHQRRYQAKNTKQAMFFLIAGFIILLICWFGVNYLPSAQMSVHVYTKQP